MGEKQRQPLAVSRQRLDKWLFFARLLKSRSLAQKAIEGGDVRVNEARINQPSQLVKSGDVIGLSIDRRVLTVRVLLPGARRGPYEEARLLYDDLTPPPAERERQSLFEQATRERGSGRPTKKERREVDRLHSGPDWSDD